jgi:hypothetical protein
MILKQIIIENTETKFINYSQVHDKYVPGESISSEDFLEGIQGEDFILPEGTKFYKRYSYMHSLFIIERPPEIRTILVEYNPTTRWRQFKEWCKKNKIENGVEYFKEKFKQQTIRYASYNFQLLLPYMIYVIFISNYNEITTSINFKVFTRPKPLEKLNSMLYSAPFFNISGNGNVCLGYETGQEVRKRGIIDTTRINNIITGFLNTQFNSEIIGSMRKYYGKTHSNYFIWEYLSRFNPLIIMSEPLVQYTLLKNVIKSSSASYKVEMKPTSIVRKISCFFPRPKLI